MGTKGAKLTGESGEAAQAFVGRVQPLGEISSKKMFGGYGIFEAGTMFALVDSQGQVFLKASDTNRARLEAAGAKPHGRMPYYQIPAAVMAEDESLHTWVREAITGSKKA